MMLWPAVDATIICSAGCYGRVALNDVGDCDACNSAVSLSVCRCLSHVTGAASQQCMGSPRESPPLVLVISVAYEAPLECHKCSTL